MPRQYPLRPLLLSLMYQLLRQKLRQRSHPHRPVPSLPNPHRRWIQQLSQPTLRPSRHARQP